jgi:predicted methyltransferase
MAERKTDYFGSFLDAMKKMGGSSQADTSADPSGRVLKALIGGERSLKDLVNLTDTSLSNLIAVVQQLEELKLVERTNDVDMLRLTDKGREYAKALQ